MRQGEKQSDGHGLERLFSPTFGRPFLPRGYCEICNLRAQIVVCCCSLISDAVNFKIPIKVDLNCSSNKQAFCRAFCECPSPKICIIMGQTFNIKCPVTRFRLDQHSVPVRVAFCPANDKLTEWVRPSDLFSHNGAHKNIPYK